MNPGSPIGAYVAAYIIMQRRYQMGYLSSGHQCERDTTPVNYTATGIILTAANLIIIGVSAYAHMWLFTTVSAITFIVSWLACFPASGKQKRNAHDVETTRERTGETGAPAPTIRVKATRAQRQRR